jgi:hypothetical protein
MLSVMSNRALPPEKPKRLVSLRPDQADYVVAFQPDDMIVFRNPDANALRKLCRQLRWEIISDTSYTLDDLYRAVLRGLSGVTGQA